MIFPNRIVASVSGKIQLLDWKSTFLHRIQQSVFPVHILETVSIIQRHVCHSSKSFHNILGKYLSLIALAIYNDHQTDVDTGLKNTSSRRGKFQSSLSKLVIDWHVTYIGYVCRVQVGQAMNVTWSDPNIYFTQMNKVVKIGSYYRQDKSIRRPQTCYQNSTSEELSITIREYTYQAQITVTAGVTCYGRRYVSRQALCVTTGVTCYSRR